MLTRPLMRTLAVLATLSATAGTSHAATHAPVNPTTHHGQRLHGSAAALTHHDLHSSKAPGTQQLTIGVWMTGHTAAAQRFITAVSTPASTQYRHFLSPDGYTQRFGPTASQVQAVQSFLTSSGFADVQPSVNHDYISATGSVATINRAFSARMRRYETGGAVNPSGTIETNNQDLTVPTAIRPDILAVTGLDSATPRASTVSTTPSSDSATCSQYWAQKTTPLIPAFDGVTEAANAVCGYSAQQIRGGYDLTAADTGAGTTIALIELGAVSHMAQSLDDYAARNGLPAPAPGQYREEHINQGPHPGGCINGYEEAVLDTEGAYAIAPRARLLMVDGNNCDPQTFGDQALFEAELAPITGHGSRPQVNIESVSYGLNGSNEQTEARASLLAYHAVLLRAAAEGVSVLDSSGDRPGLQPGDSDPDVTSVGGTTLGVGADDRRVFETGWSSDSGERVNPTDPWTDGGLHYAAGGGTSALFRAPGYQDAVVPAAFAHAGDGHDERVVPDISADADPLTSMLVGSVTPVKKRLTYGTFAADGTSLATPLVAATVADAEQGRDLGFLNPLLYSLHGTAAFSDVLPVTAADPEPDHALYEPGDTYINGTFHPGYVVGIDDFQGGGTTQVTAPGYDTMTGLGSPNGPGFISALRAAAQR